MTDRMEHLDEGTIHAWLDGALLPDESARVESHANSCTDCAALVAEARGLVAASSRILASLDAVPAGVIPGSDSGTDQLAALRARRAATRAWWRDRRFVAAASLLLVAGVSSVVWRTTANQSPVALESARVIDSVMPISAPSPASVAAPTEVKAEAEPPVRNVAPARVASRPADATANAKVAADAPVPGAGAEVTAESRAAGGAGQQRDVANAAGARQASVGAAVAPTQQQTTDSMRAPSRTDQSAFERKVQQTVQTAPTPPRIIPDQQQGAAPPPSPTSLAARNRSEVDAASLGAGLRLADVRAVAGCYRLVIIATAENARAVVDTVRLLEEAVPERSDPLWLRAQSMRGTAASTDLAWRMLDSAIVELRRRAAADTLLVRFRVVPPVTTVPDVRGVPGVRAAVVSRVVCR